MFSRRGGSSASLRSGRCATDYPIVLAHGMGFQARIMGAFDYWGAIPRTLREHGADVHVSRVNAMDSHARKGAAWREQVLSVLEKTGKPKVNVIGHSDGCIYTRYAISRLGMGPMVASHTSLAGPHRGSFVADLFMGSVPGPLRPLVGSGLDWASALAMGDRNPDCMANGTEMTRSHMKNSFNPDTPDMPGVYYQSYAFRVTNPAGAGALSPLWLALLREEGDNDGLVSVASAGWGDHKGVIDGGAWSIMGGVNHFAAVGLHPLPSPGYDPGAWFVNITAGLREMGF